MFMIFVVGIVAFVVFLALADSGEFKFAWIPLLLISWIIAGLCVNYMSEKPDFKITECSVHMVENQALLIYDDDILNANYLTGHNFEEEEIVYVVESNGYWSGGFYWEGVRNFFNKNELLKFQANNPERFDN